MAEVIEQANNELDSIEQALTTGEFVQIEDSMGAEQAIVQRTLSAETAEDVLSPDITVSARDIIGIPVELTDVRWWRSKLDSRYPVFAVAEVTRGDTGEKTVVTTSATRIMAQLLRLAQLKAFPQDVVVCQSPHPTDSGYFPLRLEAAAKE